MITLTREELNMYNYKKHQFYQTNDDIAIGLGVDSFQLYLATLGQATTQEIYEAIKEWVS